jgi:hypothetical protein
MTGHFLLTLEPNPHRRHLMARVRPSAGDFYDAASNGGGCLKPFRPGR